MSGENKKSVVDARGLSCPQPMLLTKKAIEQGETSFCVLVDSAVARGNVCRFAENKGFQVEEKEQEGDICLLLQK